MLILVSGGQTVCVIPAKYEEVVRKTQNNALLGKNLPWFDLVGRTSEKPGLTSRLLKTNSHMTCRVSDAEVQTYPGFLRKARGAHTLQLRHQLTMWFLDSYPGVRGSPTPSLKTHAVFKNPFAERWEEFLELEPWRRHDPEHVEGNGRWAWEIPSEILRTTETCEVDFVTCIPPEQTATHQKLSK